MLVTAHALGRYRERVDPRAGPGDVAAALGRARPAEWWVEEAFAHMNPDGHDLLIVRDAVFVVADRPVVRFGPSRSPGRVVVTVLLRGWAERQWNYAY